MKTFHITVAESDAEIAADRLWQLGVEAVGVHEPVDGRVELWTSVGESPASIDRAVASLEPDWTWRTEEVVEPAETWRDHVAPTWYDIDRVVVPAWQVDELRVDDNVLVTAVEPASSFGLGDHPTTELTLRLLSDHLRSSHTVGSLLDVGCGSGVLGIVAAQLGVATVRSVDISAAAVEATTANARRNGVHTRIEIDTAALSDITGPYDVVVANILAPTLVALSADLQRLTAPGGVLMISGILEANYDHVLAALAPMTVRRSLVKDGWTAISVS